jgi:hypothetical protein
MSDTTYIYQPTSEELKQMSDTSLERLSAIGYITGGGLTQGQETTPLTPRAELKLSYLEIRELEIKHLKLHEEIAELRKNKESLLDKIKTLKEEIEA